MSRNETEDAVSFDSWISRSLLVYLWNEVSYIYLDLHIEIDNEDRLRTKLYEKRDDFKFPIENFPFICSNNSNRTCIWSIYLSVDPILQSLWFLSWFFDRGLLLTRKLLNQGFLVVKWKSPLRKFCGHKWSLICSVCRYHNLVLSSCMTYHRACSKSNTTVATCGAGLAKPRSSPFFVGFRVLLDLQFSV